MRASSMLGIGLVVLVGACARGPEKTADAPIGEAPTSTTSVAPAPSDAAPATPETKLVPDEAVGPLLAALSESPGDFPSENYVTNETSLLHVAGALREPKLRDRAYVGVGPEQNYTYLGLLAPRVAYVVDIRRGNLLEHMVFRACFEAGATRAAFLGALVARRPSRAVDDSAAIDAIVGAFHDAPADRAMQDEALARTKALLDRLHVAHTPADDAALARIHSAFATHGLAIAYTMLKSGRTYPPLSETLAMRDPDGHPETFLASEERYASVRRLVVENRVLPVVGDFGGTHALRAVADDIRSRGLRLGVFYTSNVEQYLFDQRHYPAFVRSVDAMPHDEASQLVRVWFDQGRAHPDQRPKHRTTQLVIPVSTFLARAAQKPFKSYWEVVTQPGAVADAHHAPDAPGAR